MTGISNGAPEGVFVRLHATQRLSAALQDNCPEILWLPDAELARLPAVSDQAALIATHYEGDNAAPMALASRSGEWPELHFDAALVAEAILLERYHSGLEPTLEMRLPFNYSRVPRWLKAIALRGRRSAVYAEPGVPFPPGAPSFVVDWLCDLADWAGGAPSQRSLACPWPDGRRGAVCITHDVDTDWIFEHPAWLERLCDVEERHGFFAAWYCVPAYSRSRAARKGIARLRDRACEIGCHGYNHDAKWALLEGRRFERRMAVVREFASEWEIRGFRSEWLWRSPRFLEAIASVFEYDSSVPNVYSGFTSTSRNGCGTCYPYRGHANLVELPLTLPMDSERHRDREGPEEFWQRQLNRAVRVIERGGVAVLSLHTEPQHSANEANLSQVEKTLAGLAARSDVWIARPHEIVEWATRDHQPRSAG